MLYEIWYRVSRTVFPFISLKQYHATVDELKDMIEANQEAYDELGEELDAALIELDNASPLPPLDNFMVNTADERDIGRMENDGVIDPNHYREA